MSPSRQFTFRPVASSLLMTAISLTGIVAYRQRPVSALPQVDYPTIEVVTFYPGASPAVAASAITAPLERQFGQLPGLNQMTSISSGGSSIIVLQFVLTLNIDVAEQEVQAAINAAQTYLPTGLPSPPIYSKSNPADAPILTLALTSKTFPLAQVQDFADTRLAQKISQLPGANIIQVVDRVKSLLPQLRSNLPASIDVSILTDRTTTIRASVRDVQFSLILTVALVVMAIFLFLRTFSATIIPSVAVPVSIVGTLGVMYLLGYRLDNLSLMALTISTGVVVADAA